MNRLSVLWLIAMLVACVPAARGDELPEDAARLVAAFEEDAEAQRLETERKIALERRELARKLKELQDKYTRAALLDEAVAIRDKIRSLSESSHPAQPDPGTMTAYTGRIGEKFHFRVTGNLSGSVYGTDVFTYDSTVATAAVHSGLLKVGETAVLKVTMLPGRPSYLASTRNGVTSSAWGSYQASFQVERIKEFVLPAEDKTPNGGAAPGDKPGADRFGADTPAIVKPEPRKPVSDSPAPAKPTPQEVDPRKPTPDPKPPASDEPKAPRR
jgi:hypothetical protein